MPSPALTTSAVCLLSAAPDHVSIRRSLVKTLPCSPTGCAGGYKGAGLFGTKPLVEVSGIRQGVIRCSGQEGEPSLGDHDMDLSMRPSHGSPDPCWTWETTLMLRAYSVLAISATTNGSSIFFGSLSPEHIWQIFDYLQSNFTNSIRPYSVHICLQAKLRAIRLFHEMCNSAGVFQI